MIRESAVEEDLWGASVFATETHRVASSSFFFFSFFFFNSPRALPLSPLSSLSSGRKEKSSAAGNSFLAAAASRELISVLDRREFFQVLKVFSSSFIAYLFQARERKNDEYARHPIVRHKTRPLRMVRVNSVNKIITIRSIESVFSIEFTIFIFWFCTRTRARAEMLHELSSHVERVGGFRLPSTLIINRYEIDKICKNYAR